jgi:outer membrane autotransporter protein
MRPSTTTGSTYDADQLKLQAGVDGLLLQNEGGRLIGGITVQYGTASADVRSFYGDGKISTTGYGFGATLTWYGENGFYVDGQAQGMIFSSSLKSALIFFDMARDNDGVGHALSVETGKRIALGGGWTVTPQAQLVYSAIDFDSFNDRFGARVSLEHADSLKGRLGLSAENSRSWVGDGGRLVRTNVYGIANLYYEFREGTQVNVAGTPFANANERLWGGIGGGSSYNWSNDQYSLYAEAQLSTGLEHFGDSYSVGGTLGFRAKF